MTAWLGFFGVVVAAFVALYTNAARLAQERWLKRLDRLRDALDAATERLMQVHARDDPHDDQLDHAMWTVAGELVAGRSRLILWFDESDDVIKAWEEAARALMEAKELLWSGRRDQEIENATNAVVLNWSVRARAEIRRQEAAVPSVWRLLARPRSLRA